VRQRWLWQMLDPFIKNTSESFETRPKK